MDDVKIAIVGASFAGLRAYLTLRSKLPNATIYLFDKHDMFSFIPSFHLVLANKERLAASQFSLKKYFKESFIQDEVVSIQKNKLQTKKKSYDFDYLIVATGAQVNYFGNESLKKYSYGAKSIDDLEAIWKELPKAKKVTIIGGGLSGVEYAAVLASQTDKEITLISGSDMVLPALSTGARKYANNYLLKKGVKIIDNVYAQSVTKKTVTLTSKKTIKTDLILCCTGLDQSTPLLDSQEVTNTLHLKNKDNVFLCGDVVRTSKVPTAHSAMIEGDIAAQHVVARVKGCQPKAREIKKQTTLAVALGSHHGFLHFKHLYIPTIFTGFMKRWIELSVLFSFKKRLKLFI